jgi:hypothetical protein
MIQSVISLILGTYAATFPYWIAKFLYKNKETLHKDDFMRRYSTLYLGLRTKEEYTLLYPSIFLLRKLLFVLIAFVFDFCYF